MKGIVAIASIFPARSSATRSHGLNNTKKHQGNATAAFSDVTVPLGRHSNRFHDVADAIASRASGLMMTQGRDSMMNPWDPDRSLTM
jgi:hypothetical protein